jgi:hypothetical protein
LNRGLIEETPAKSMKFWQQFLLGLLLAKNLVVTHADSTHWQKLSNVWSVFGGFVLRKGHVNRMNKLGKNVHGLKVIGGGFPRTGTKTIETALAMIGHKVYDNRAMIEHKHYSRWINATRSWLDDGDLTLTRQMVDEIETLGYTATLDIPLNLLAPQLIRVRSDAKVLWHYRAKGVEDWYESLSFINWFFESLVYGRPWKWITTNPAREMMPLTRMILSIYKPELNYPEHFDRPLPWYDQLKNNKHHMETNEELKQNFTKAYTSWPSKLQDALIEVKGDDALKTQYLEYTVQEGWDPLLTFLLDDPNDRQSVMELLAEYEFPHVNDRHTLKMIKRLLDFLGIIFPLVVALVLLAVFVSTRALIRLTKAICSRSIGLWHDRSRVQLSKSSKTD